MQQKILLPSRATRKKPANHCWWVLCFHWGRGYRRNSARRVQLTAVQQSGTKGGSLPPGGCPPGWHRSIPGHPGDPQWNRRTIQPAHCPQQGRNPLRCYRLHRGCLNSTFPMKKAHRHPGSRDPRIVQPDRWQAGSRWAVNNWHCCKYRASQASRGKGCLHNPRPAMPSPQDRWECRTRTDQWWW